MGSERKAISWGFHEAWGGNAGGADARAFHSRCFGLGVPSVAVEPLQRVRGGDGVGEALQGHISVNPRLDNAWLAATP